MDILKKVVNFFFELSVLKRIPRSGWRNIGIENPNSVAEHVFSTTQIAYILGKMEKINAERAALIALFHDNGEARIGDENVIAKLYSGANKDRAEKKAFFDQIKDLPGEKEIKEISEEWERKETPESIVARDADTLEAAIQAKCYLDSGNKLAKLWIKWYKSRVKTKSAKKIIEAIEKTNIDEWWKEIPWVRGEIKKLKKGNK